MFAWPGLGRGRKVVGMRLEKQEAPMEEPCGLQPGTLKKSWFLYFAAVSLRSPADVTRTHKHGILIVFNI